MTTIKNEEMRKNAHVLAAIWENHYARIQDVLAAAAEWDIPEELIDKRIAQIKHETREKIAWHIHTINDWVHIFYDYNCYRRIIRYGGYGCTKYHVEYTNFER